MWVTPLITCSHIRMVYGLPRNVWLVYQAFKYIRKLQGLKHFGYIIMCADIPLLSIQCGLKSTSSPSRNWLLGFKKKQVQGVKANVNTPADVRVLKFILNGQRGVLDRRVHAFAC